MVGEAVDIEAQLRAQPELQEDMARFRKRFLEGSGMSMEKLAFFPAVFRYGVVMFAFERESGALFGWMNE